MRWSLRGGSAFIERARDRRVYWTWLWLLATLVVGFGLLARNALAQDAECAEVKIVIEQKLSLERQAFDARMVIRNGLESSALTNVKVDLVFKDRDQNDVIVTSDPSGAGATFFVRLDNLSGLSSLNGSANLAAKSTADIRWLLIPSQGAGGTTAEGKLYYIGAKVTYTLDGITSTVDVTPDYVVVRPQPLLRLDYFLPTDIYADDPFTPEVEVAEPFTLGVRVANVGAGAAPKTQIESAQPKIVENRQGLLIDFTILGGFVGNAPAGKSLLLDFGDIPAQAAKMGRWLMQTSLAGRFTEFTASFVHADSLGGAVTSLIQDVVTHKLVHDVRIELPGHDDIDDFLAEQGDGYRVYDSLGGDGPVFDLSPSATLTAKAAGTMVMQFPPTRGMVHVKLSDPNQGAKKLAQVLRSDGKQLIAQNFWLSRSRNVNLSWSYFVHIFDYDTTGQYTLVFTNGTNASLEGMAYRDANGNGVKDAGEPSEGNLAVTLKGIDELGRNVTIPTYTDPNGNFGFSGVVPGKYQLEAGSRDGWINGAWVAGSAGGKAVSGLISDIVLVAGAQASGYVISKRKTPASGQGTADVSVSITSSTNELKPGQTAAITMTARNAGPDAASAVVVQAALPSGLVQDSPSTPSIGSYTLGAWTIGDLAKDQTATLTVQARAADLPSGSNSRVVSWTAAAGAQSSDPVSTNNQATVGLLIRKNTQDDVELTQAFLSQARVLLWASCTGSTTPANAQACARDQANTAQTWLTPQVAQISTATQLTDWRAAMRTGAYNVLWFVGAFDTLDSTAIAEIQAAVRRGDSVIVEGASGVGMSALAGMLGGVAADVPVGSDLAVQLQGGVSQTTNGNAYPLNQQGGTVLATYPSSGKPAIISSTWGNGQTLLIGFPLLATARQVGNATWSAFAQQQLAAMTPLVRTQPALAGSQWRTQYVARSLGQATDPALNLALQVDMPGAMETRDAVPAPNSGATPAQVIWDATLTGGQERAFALSVIVPAKSMTGAVQAKLLNSSSQAQVASNSFNVEVLGLDTLVPRVQQSLAGINGGSAELQSRASNARATLSQLLQAQTDARWSSVMELLANLQSQLQLMEAISGAPVMSDLLLDVARWFYLAQLRWTPDSTPAPAQVTTESGSGQTTQIGTVFASRLTAKVVDATGLPVAGVAVQFELPATGASATFAANGAAVATVTALSDARGLAQSPAMTANMQVGRYVARASIAAGSGSATFDLENIAQPAPVLSLQLVDGSGQSARVGSVFAKPLTVRVVNSQNRPQAGVVVRFEAPATGATAAFDAQGASSAQVTTDGNGLAVSPAVRAQGTFGSYQVRAVIVSSPAVEQLMGLSNQPLPPTSPSFSGTTATGSGTFSASVSGGGAGCGFNPDATKLLPPTGMGALLGRILLPHGVFDFELLGCTPGGEVTITTTWPDLRGITGYLKYGATPQSGGAKMWYPPMGLRISGNTVTYTIRDGGWGDDDLTVNGVIRDPGGPVVMASSDPLAIPALHSHVLWVLALLLAAVAGSVHIKRQRKP